MRIRCSLYLLVFSIVLIANSTCLAESQTSFNNQQECSLRIIQDGLSITPRMENNLNVYKLKANNFKIEVNSDSCSPGIYVLSQRSQIDYLTKTPLIFAGGGFGIAINYNDADVLPDVPKPVNLNLSLDELIRLIDAHDASWAKQQYKELSVRLGYNPTPMKAYALYIPFINPETAKSRNYAEFKKFKNPVIPISEVSGKVIYAVVYTKSENITKPGNRAPSYYLLKPHIIAFNFTDNDNIKDIEAITFAEERISDKNDKLIRSAKIGSPQAIWKALHKASTNADDLSSSKNAKLTRAAEAGRLQDVQSALVDGVDLNARDAYYADCTALILASQKGHTDIVKFLLDKGADVNVKAGMGFTALTFASFNGHIDIVKILLSKGADVNVEGTAVMTHGMTPLMAASRGGHIEVVKLLIDHRANINIIPINGASALTYASFGGYMKIAELLLDKGADVNTKNVYVATPLIAASDSGNIEITKLLLDKGANVNASTNNGHTALIAASEKGHTEIVKLLLNKGADMNVKAKDGDTAMSVAKKVDITEMLKKAGAKE